ncbi:unnamed protein product [Vitrella brassicaformis CCMP3155]|uniref:C2H2-type domain-containing protein n=1 Tax=Vitrella brassicaformis (strain CCMP3155) TaxID=1169540 RepID=A0A0G4EP00_VITBC|nr:unnamed protein product [Vitrella brassicaformis CCMP3155]|eukprot:CEL99353.1 unnamed protein product [Vitrella brassicaformis CCMP3155]
MIRVLCLSLLTACAATYGASRTMSDSRPPSPSPGDEERRDCSLCGESRPLSDFVALHQGAAWPPPGTDGRCRVEYCRYCVVRLGRRRSRQPHRHRHLERRPEQRGCVWAACPACRQLYCPECVLGVDSLREVPADPLAPPPPPPDHRQCPLCDHPYGPGELRHVPCECNSLACPGCTEQARNPRSGELVCPYSQAPEHFYWHETFMDLMLHYTTAPSCAPARCPATATASCRCLPTGSTPAASAVVQRAYELTGPIFPTLDELITRGTLLVSGSTRIRFQVIDEPGCGGNCALNGVRRQLHAYRRRRAAVGRPHTDRLPDPMPSAVALRGRLVDDLLRRRIAGEFDGVLLYRGNTDDAVHADAYIEGIRSGGEGLSEVEMRSVANMTGATMVLCDRRAVEPQQQPTAPFPVSVRMVVHPEPAYQAAGTPTVHLLYLHGHWVSMVPAESQASGGPGPESGPAAHGRRDRSAARPTYSVLGLLGELGEPDAAGAASRGDEREIDAAGREEGAADGEPDAAGAASRGDEGANDAAGREGGAADAAGGEATTAERHEPRDEDAAVLDGRPSTHDAPSAAAVTTRLEELRAEDALAAQLSHLHTDETRLDPPAVPSLASPSVRRRVTVTSDPPRVVVEVQLADHSESRGERGGSQQEDLLLGSNSQSMDPRDSHSGERRDTPPSDEHRCPSQPPARPLLPHTREDEEALQRELATLNEDRAVAERIDREEELRRGRRRPRARQHGRSRRRRLGSADRLTIISPSASSGASSGDDPMDIDSPHPSPPAPSPLGDRAAGEGSAQRPPRPPQTLDEFIAAEGPNPPGVRSHQAIRRAWADPPPALARQARSLSPSRCPPLPTGRRRSDSEIRTTVSAARGALAGGRSAAGGLRGGRRSRAAGRPGPDAGVDPRGSRGADSHTDSAAEGPRRTGTRRCRDRALQQPPQAGARRSGRERGDE